MEGHQRAQRVVQALDPDRGDAAVVGPGGHPAVAHDRCDQCGAQAYTKVVLASGVLLFCGHHGKANMDALAKVALEIFESPVTS